MDSYPNSGRRRSIGLMLTAAGVLAMTAACGSATATSAAGQGKPADGGGQPDLCSAAQREVSTQSLLLPYFDAKSAPADVIQNARKADQAFLAIAPSEIRADVQVLVTYDDKREDALSSSKDFPDEPDNYESAHQAVGDYLTGHGCKLS